MSIATQNPANLRLIVDLDDTLIRTDSLFENFWSACSVKWYTPFAALTAVLQGPLVLKERLSAIASINPAQLPYNGEVLDIIRGWRERGGQVSLVTASVQETANAVAQYLDLFDEVHGSGNGINLKGTKKAEFIKSKYNSEGYVYIGDAAADLPIWELANIAVTINSSASLRSQVEEMCAETEHLSCDSLRSWDFVRALRPHQWLKNLLVFAPMLGAHQISLSTFMQSLLAFIAFSFVASSSYVLNDLLDLAADRAHPRKQNRPFASGSLKVSHGTWMIPGLAALGGATALLSGSALFAMLAAYFIITTLYSAHLKRFAVVDICLLAVLYTMRIFAGSIATGIPSSVWLLAFSTFFFFSLASIKRQAELVDGIASGKARTNGRGYCVDDLPVVSAMASSSGMVSVLVLALYANSEPVRQLYSIPEVLWAICPVLLFWNNRMAILTNRGLMHDDPLVFAARDRASYCCIAIIALLALVGIWL